MQLSAYSSYTQLSGTYPYQSGFSAQSRNNTQTFPKAIPQQKSPVRFGNLSLSPGAVAGIAAGGIASLLAVLTCIWAGGRIGSFITSDRSRQDYQDHWYGQGPRDLELGYPTYPPQ